MTEGLRYQRFRAYDSNVHLLTVDLERREIRPVMGAEQFPFKMCQPILTAVADGCLASVGSGYNLTRWHMKGNGVSDQPLHALVVDGELWTDGLGQGTGFLLGEGWAHVQQNRIQVHVWGGGSGVQINSVNLGHDGLANAFTPRGGTNAQPDPDKPLTFLPDAVVETLVPIWFGEDPKWKQDLGAEGVNHIVSGIPQILKDGENVVPLLNLDPAAPHGPDGWWVRRNPRMALGTSADRRTAYLCTVEGRIPGSRGVRLKQLASVMQRHGVANAVNMDGGGSAFMYHRGELVADSCYGDGTLEGLRPDHYAVAVF